MMNTGHDQLASSTSYYANEDGSKDYSRAVTCTCGVSVTVSFTTAADSPTPPPSGITDVLGGAAITALAEHIEANTETKAPVETWRASDPAVLLARLETAGGPMSLSKLCEALDWPSSRVKRAWYDLVAAGPSERYEIVRGPSGEGVSYALVRPVSKPTRCEFTWHERDGYEANHVHRCRYGTMSNFAHNELLHVCDACGASHDIEGTNR